MKKRQVLIVVHQLNHGGVQKSLISALNAIDYNENDVTLYIRKSRLDLLPDVNKNVARIIVNEDRTRYYRKPAAAWLQLRLTLCEKLGRAEKSAALKEKLDCFIISKKTEYEKKCYFSSGEKYDVAVSYIQGYTAGFVADCVDADRKIVFYHGSTDETHDVHECVFGCYDKIVAVNSGCAEVLARLYPAHAEKITYLENCVDAASIGAKAAEPVDISHDRLMLCSCGRLSPVKGFDLAVGAAKTLKERGIAFRWYFVGDGPDREKLEQSIKESGLSDEIVITGMQQNPYPWIGACDIYVQPSYEEAYGLTIAEAKILCRPVVSTSTVGGKCLINSGKDGILTEISAESIADGITELAQSSELREKLSANLAATDHSHDMDNYRSKWKELLKG